MLPLVKNYPSDHLPRQQSVFNDVMPPTDVRQPESHSENLRLHIVEMAGKRGPQPGQGNTYKETRVFKIDNFDTAKHIRQHLAELEVSTKTRQRFSALSHQKTRIDLDVAKTQRQPSQYQPHPPISSRGSPKLRAAPGILNHVRRRDDVNEDVSLNKTGGHNTHQSQNHAGEMEPLKKARAISSGVEKNYLQTRPKSWKFKQDEDSSNCPTTHFPSNDSSESKAKNLRISDRNGQTHEYQHCDERATVNTTGNNNGKRTAVRVYEVKGNAMPTPPPRQNSAKRVGLFSASLEAFKRRLRISSNKYSHRLNGEDIDKTEEYVIRANDAGTNNLTPQKSAYSPQPLLQPHPPTQPRKSSNIRPFINFKTAHQKSRPQNDTDCMESRLVQIREERMKEVTSDNQTHPNDPYQWHTQGDQSPGKPPNSPEEPRKFSYRLSEDSPEDRHVSFRENTKALPNVKTYVVENERTLNLNSTPLQSAPLTVHNLRVHDSLQAMYDRRVKKLQRHYQQQQLNNSSDSTGSSSTSEASITDRMQKWLTDATELSTIQPTILVKGIGCKDLDEEEPLLEHMLHLQGGVSDAIMV